MIPNGIDEIANNYFSVFSVSGNRIISVYKYLVIKNKQILRKAHCAVSRG